MKIGAVTIGQSPRVDVTPDILPILGDKIELLQAGALDGLSREEIEDMAPGPEDYVLVSRLNDGSFAKFGESFILERMQNCISKLTDHDFLRRIFPGCFSIARAIGISGKNFKRAGKSSE